MTRIANGLSRREMPKIFGSSAAFIAVIVVLIAIIIVSLSAIIYLLRGERKRSAEDQEAQRRRRYNAQPLINRDLTTPPQSKKWYSYFKFWSSRDQHNHTLLDKSTAMVGHSEEGWIQANNREWDVNDFTEDRAMQSGLSRMSENGSSTSVPQFYAHRMDFPTSDDASSVRYDPHEVRGLPYPDRFPIFPQATIKSQLSSPASSSPSSPVPPRTMKSPEPIFNASSHNSSYDNVRDSLPRSPLPVRANGNGSRFFESF